MKKLLLIRHCKSDWADPGLSDHDRPLNKRGINDRPVITKRLMQLAPAVEHFFHSTAKRATDTAQFIHQNWRPELPIESRSFLYTFNASELFYFIQNLPNDLNHVVLVSHNPGLTDLINDLTNIRLDNLPTGGFCHIEFPVDDWSQIRDGMGEVDFLEYPKMLN